MVLQQAEFERGRTAVIVPLQVALANALTVAAGLLVFRAHLLTARHGYCTDRGRH